MDYSNITPQGRTPFTRLQTAKTSSTSVINSPAFTSPYRASINHDSTNNTSKL